MACCGCVGSGRWLSPYRSGSSAVPRSRVAWGRIYRRRQALPVVVTGNLGGTIVVQSTSSTGVPDSDDRPAGTELISHKRDALRSGLLLSFMLLIVAIGACSGGVLLVKSDTETYLYPAAFIVAGFVLVLAAAAPIVMFREACLEEDEDKKCQRDCDELDTALDGIGDPTLSGLAKANFRQMRMFTAVALRQARMSFYASLAAASASLLVLATGGVTTAGLAGTGAKAAAGSVTAVGVAMSGFLSSTFLKTYWMSARQMSYYYGQPLVHCYLLHAEWLTLMLTKHPDWQADADLWKQVVAASIRAGQDAHDHLLSMQQDSPGPRHGRQGRTSDRHPEAGIVAATINTPS
jgi:hypothetical protein